MKFSLNSFVTAARVPYLLGLGFLAFSGLYYALELPHPQEIFKYLEQAYGKWGYAAVFFAILIESIFVISFYLPGSMIVLLCVILVGDNLIELIRLCVVLYAGIMSGLLIDYAIGYFGLQGAFSWFGGYGALTRAKLWSAKWGRKATFIFGFHPNALSLIAVYRGIGRENFRIAFFDFALTLLFWVPVAVYLMSLIVSKVSATNNQQHWFVFSAFVIWGTASGLISGFGKTDKNLANLPKGATQVTSDRK